MKRILPLLLVLLLPHWVLLSCQKELVCSTCQEDNVYPVASAGTDQTIMLPQDSAILDGTASFDPDGTIKAYSWAKVEGPFSANIKMPNAFKTNVYSLVAGLYKFELTITDDGGLSDKDTVEVLVKESNNILWINHPPVACAGPDQLLVLPASSAALDGSCSTDPDNNIQYYSWSKVAGPAFSTQNTSVARMQIWDLVQGVYQFQLTVTDSSGSKSMDTVQITVQYPALVDCNGRERKQVTASLIPFGTLSLAREGVTVAAAANKIVFAGGYQSSPFKIFSRVDIYDIVTNTWATYDLPLSSTIGKAAVLGNKIYFPSMKLDGGNASTVFVYDALNNTWSSISIPNFTELRFVNTVAAAGNKVLFVSGSFFYSPSSLYYTIVDIFNVQTNSWQSDTLHNRTHGNPDPYISDAGIAATSIGNKVYLAGNASDWTAFDFGTYSSTINIYDVGSDNWTTSKLSKARGFMADLAVGDKIIWAGGVHKQPPEPYTDLVEIRDVRSGLSTFTCLSKPNGVFSAAVKGNKVVFFTSAYEGYNTLNNSFDIYDISINTWSIGIMSKVVYGASIVSVNNSIYVAGGKVDGNSSNQVYKLEF